MALLQLVNLSFPNSCRATEVVTWGYKELIPLDFIFLADEDQTDYHWNDNNYQPSKQTVEKVR